MFCITHASASAHPTRLPPFAMWPAFPAADYYEGSVAMRVAPGRQSRVPSTVDVQAGLGALFVSLVSLEATLFPGACRGRRAPSLCSGKYTLLSGETPDVIPLYPG